MDLAPYRDPPIKEKGDDLERLSKRLSHEGSRPRMPALCKRYENMQIYPKQTVKSYSAIRDSITCTDDAVFGVLNKIGIAGKEILDFGCGDGTYAFKLIQLGVKRVDGVDISPAMIELAEKRRATVPHVHFQVVDGNELPFPEGTFDLVFANFVLQHFPQTAGPIREIYRVLKPTGRFVGVSPITHFKKEFEYLFNTELPIILGKKVAVLTLAKDAEEIKRDMIGAGFEILTYTEIENPDAEIRDRSYQEKVERYNTIVFDARKPA